MVDNKNNFWDTEKDLLTKIKKVPPKTGTWLRSGEDGLWYQTLESVENVNEVCIEGRRFLAEACL